MDGKSMMGLAAVGQPGPSCSSHPCYNPLRISTFPLKGGNKEVEITIFHKFVSVVRLHCNAHYTHRVREHQELTSLHCGFSARHNRYQWTKWGGQNFTCRGHRLCPVRLPAL